MIFLEQIPYKIGTSFEENNIDLELRKKFNVQSLYSSYRYSEIYIFGKVFESICYLWFMNNELSTIEYRFHKRHLQLFIESINEELPINNQLGKDPFVENYEYYVYHNNVAIHLIELDSNFFLLKLSAHPSLPRIKKEIK